MRFLIKNSTNAKIELSQSSVETKSLFAKSTYEVNMTLISHWHGHSEIGSFIITKRYDTFNIKSYGKLSLKLIQNGNSTNFEVVEKNSSE